ncbi:unnamed protein product [Anisakis simplex]|uniref:cyclin-dependent kinase n=1 Tax=Anisakis simplex TaxID=6269 RepID=A0A0M3K268_ANISI|nr:unnamed protein product [Anisakis simplex]
MNELAERLAMDGVIIEECESNMASEISKSVTFHNLCAEDDTLSPLPSQLPTPNSFSSWIQLFLLKKRHLSSQRSLIRPSVSLSVVDETRALGSDGESIDVSPSTSDQSGTTSDRCAVNVKMRPKPTRRWSEEDIQKRLSLPADLRLPLSVVEKLNRTPTLDQPLTRKNRRASLSEIGFGKLETYEKLEKLGEGTYASVYKGRSRLTDKFVALKEIRLEQEEGAPCTAIREVSLLRELKHANVVTLHDIIHTDRMLTLVFEYVDRDLKQYLDECIDYINMHNVKLFLLQLLRGLNYCHKRRVLHRDLKPQNLLINERGELKLADFGLARAKSVPTKTYSNEVVTLWYRPPDVLLGSTNYSTHIDMWGVGCILFEMISVSGRALFPGSAVDEQLLLIFHVLGTPSPAQHPSICNSSTFKSYKFPQYYPSYLPNICSRIDQMALDLLLKLLKYEGRERLSALQALDHQFLRSTLPDVVFKLSDNESVMNVNGVKLIRETFSQRAVTNNHHHHHNAAATKHKSNQRHSLIL